MIFLNMKKAVADNKIESKMITTKPYGIFHVDRDVHPVEASDC